MTKDKILLVEDENIEAMDLKRILESFGYTVPYVASSGEEAIEKTLEIIPDLILMDIVLKGEIDGIEAASKIKYLNIPVIFLTAHSIESTVEKAKLTEPYGYIIKPYNPTELKYSIDLAIYKNKMEKRLKENEEKYRSIFENSMDAILLTKPNGDILEVNPATEKLFGYTSKEIYDLGRSGLINDGRLPELLKERELKGKVKGELNFIRKDGSEFIAEISSAIFKDRNGNEKTIIAIKDITQSLKDKKALKDHEEKLRLKLDKILSPEYVIEDYEFENILKTQEIQSMMDDFHKITKMGIAIVDLKGNIIISTSWQDICTKFHRSNKNSCKNCIESDLKLTQNLDSGEIRLYKCKNNMWDIATPLTIGEKNIGNLYMGQFFFDDEKLDEKLFESQAEKFGFDKEEYMAAFNRVPKLNRAFVKNAINFYSKFAKMISNLSYSNIKLAKLLSDYKKAKNDLLENEEFMDNIFENIPIMIFIKSAEKLEFERVNTVAEIIMGHPREELIGKTDYDFFKKDDADFFIKKDMEALQKKKLVDIPSETIETENGGQRILHTKKIPILNKDGSPQYLLGISEDITSRKKAEEALQESERNYRELVDNSMVGIFKTNLKGEILFANDSMAKIFHYDSVDDLKKYNIIKIYKNYEDRLQLIQKLKKTGIVKNYEIESIGKKGEVVNVLLSATLKDGMLSGMFMDITDRKMSELNLKESEIRYRTLYSSMNEGLALHRIIYNEDNKPIDYQIIDVNPSYEKILGIKKETILGKKASEIYETETAPYLEIYSKVAQTGKPKQFETFFEPMDKYFNISIFSPSKGTFATVFEDISARKTAEKDIKTSLKEKEILLKEIHHRVKNNMQIISSLLNLQTRYLKDDVAINVLKESQNRIKSMAIIHQKLYESNNLTHIKFNAYIKNLVNDLFYSYNIHQDQVKQTLDVEDVKLNMETAIPSGLIISELVSNSLKHAFPDGKKGEIKVSLKKYDDKYELIISDNGIGLPESIDFKNINSLGLQLVNNLVLQIDGEITLDKSQGTKFKIIFYELKYKERM
jgi:PAS domain S-box-containing protein